MSSFDRRTLFHPSAVMVSSDRDFCMYIQKSVTLSVGTPLCPYGNSYRRTCGLSAETRPVPATPCKGAANPILTPAHSNTFRHLLKHSWTSACTSCSRPERKFTFLHYPGGLLEPLPLRNPAPATSEGGGALDVHPMPSEKWPVTIHLDAL